MAYEPPMPDCWTETVVTVPADLAEAVGSFLLDLGSPGLVTAEGDGTVALTAFLASDATVQLEALRTFCDDLTASAPNRACAGIVTRRLLQADWAHSWMAHFPPLAVGERLYIVPPWIDEIPSERIPIVIDPGLAFGTGHHATTQGCLVLLERAVSAQSVRRALDLGTGSGILAIALAKLGVAEIEAVDIDPEARRAAADNCARNGVATSVSIGDALRPTLGEFDLIVANLLSTLLIDLAPKLVGALALGGHVIASGILSAEAEGVAQAFAAHHLEERARIADGEWITFDFALSP